MGDSRDGAAPGVCIEGDRRKRGGPGGWFAARWLLQNSAARQACAPSNRLALLLWVLTVQYRPVLGTGHSTVAWARRLSSTLRAHNPVLHYCNITRSDQESLACCVPDGATQRLILDGGDPDPAQVFASNARAQAAVSASLVREQWRLETVKLGPDR
ncbi:hypothetical protein B7463_g10298, partial [Scytalidium lignicola]